MLNSIKPHLANIITLCRMVGSITLCSFKGLTPGFIGVYTFCGITDALDGFVARKLHTESKLGSKLDSISDLLFYTVMMLKIWPILKRILPDFVFVIIFTILGVRVACYAFVFARDKKLASEHFLLNKVTGLLLFILPYLLKWDGFLYYALVVCLIALIAATYEFYFHLTKKHDC